MCPSLGGRYLQTTIWKSGKYRTRRVHVLVCEAFHGPAQLPGMEVRHLDDNPLNNRVGNLAWGTRVDNMQDSIRNGTNNRLARTRCPRGHGLTAPNLVRSILALGRRNCRACHQARGAVSRAALRGVALDLAVTADAAYRRITAGVS